MKKTLIFILMVTVLTFAMFSAVMGTKVLSEVRITTNAFDQTQPAIYRDIIVWRDNRNGNNDIYGYNLNTKTEFPICTAAHAQGQPAIYGDIVVWRDRRNGTNYNIWATILRPKQSLL